MNLKHISPNIFLYIFSCCLFLAACKKTSDSATQLNVNTSTTLLGVSYGTDTLQKMDIFLPAGRSVDTTKVMVLVHGGSWTSGDKADVAFLIDSFKNYIGSYAFVNINYRLATYAGANLFPAQEADVKQALEFIINNQSTYQYNTNKLVLLGESAGGQLALLQAYKYASVVNPKAAIDLAGVTDMTGLYNYYAASKPTIALGLSFLMGGTPTTNASLYNSSSPVNYITSSSTPTVILHGSADTIVPINQSDTLSFRLSQNTVKHEFYSYSGIGHTLSSPATFEDAFPKVIDFVKKMNP